MKKIILSFILLITTICSCNKSKEKDFSEINHLISITDSLLELTNGKFDIASEQFYMLIEDSAKTDSIALYLNIPDSVGVYQYIEMGVNDLNEMVSFTQKEIYFAQEHLHSVKNEFIEKQISQSEYINQLIESKELIAFLKERVDSNIYIMREKYQNLFYLYNDSTY